MNPKMGLLGGGDTTASGWGQPPASGSSASWGSSPGGSNSTSSGWNSTTSVSSTNHWGNNGHQTNGETNESSSSSSHSAYPKHSWAQAVCINRGPNQTQVPNYSGSCNSSSNSSRSHVENSSDIQSKYPTSSSTSNEQQQQQQQDSGMSKHHHHESSNRVLPTEVLIADNWGHAVSVSIGKFFGLLTFPSSRSLTRKSLGISLRPLMSNVPVRVSGKVPVPPERRFGRIPSVKRSRVPQLKRKLHHR